MFGITKVFSLLCLVLVINVDASFLLGHLERCADDYYYSGNRLYYLNSKNQKWFSTTSNVGFIEDGYIHDNETGICTKKPILKELGLKEDQYQFLIALTALLLGFTTIFFMTYTVIEVAKK